MLFYSVVSVVKGHLQRLRKSHLLSLQCFCFYPSVIPEKNVPSSSPLLSLSTGDISTPSGEKLTINLTSYSLSRFHPLVSSQRRARFCSSCRKACFSISFLNSPCLLPSSSVCWPHSAIRCWSSTATAFAFWMVERR